MMATPLQYVEVQLYIMYICCGLNLFLIKQVWLLFSFVLDNDNKYMTTKNNQTSLKKI